MSVAVITVGNELLSGLVTDLNRAWIGERLTTVGCRTTWHVTVGDDPQKIQAALRSVPPECKDVIVTGGLGPTHDDLTLKVCCDYFDTELVFDADYWQVLKSRFRKRGRDIPEINRNQALVPRGFPTIPNRLGSARGAIFHNDRQRVFILPGVPAEMQAMLEEEVLPRLGNGAELYSTVLRTTGVMESVLAEKLAAPISRLPEVTVAFLPRITGVDIHLVSHTADTLSALQSAIEGKVRKYIYGYGTMELEEVVGELLVERGLTLAVAESCSGGLVSHRLTNIPGSSRYMLGGIVAYSNQAKCRFLGVREETLQAEGAVSSQTACEMAAGVRERFRSALGIGITGIAGPGGGRPGKPVGLVYVGYADAASVSARKFRFPFDRRMNKRLSSQVALNMIRIKLQNGG